MKKIAKFQLEDGRIAKFEVPADYTEDQAISEIMSMMQAQQPEKEQDGSGFFPNLNRSILGAAGAPADLLSSAGKAIGIVHEGFEPVIGSKSIMQGARNIGLNVADDNERGFTSRAGRITGDALSLLVGGGAVAQKLAQGTTRAAPYAKNLIDMVVSNPKKLAALEALGIGGAAAGGELAYNITEGTSPMAEMLGEVVGGVAAPFAASGGIMGRGAVSAAKGAMFPFTESGGTARAAKRVQESVVDSQDALARLGDEGMANLTPAQRIGDQRLLEIESAAYQQTPQLAERYAQDIAENLASLRGQAAIEGDIGSSRDFLSARREGVLTKAQQDAENALVRALEATEGLTPSMRTTDASRIVRNELENAYQKAKGRERQAWESVPKASMNPTVSRNMYAEIMENLPRAQKEDMPVVASELLGQGGLRGFQRLSELQGLRSKLLEQGRIARAAGEGNKARISDMMADALLEDLGAKAGQESGRVGQALADALAETRAVRETFGQGDIARILGTDRSGADRIAEELTLQTLVGTGRDRGAAGVNRLLQATDTPATQSAVESYLREGLQSAAIRDGKLNPVAAETFLRKNAETLDKMPQLKDELISSIKAQRDADRLAGREKQLSASLLRQQQSATAQFLEAPIGKEIQTILSSKNPQQSAKNIISLMRKDPDAVNGVRSATVQHIFRNAETKQFDALGNPLLSGNKMVSQLKDPRQRAAFEEILGADGVEKLDTIASYVVKIEKALAASPANRIIDDTPNKVINSVVGTMLARFGAQLGKGTSGASLKTASMATREGNVLMRRLTGDKAEEILTMAVQDEELMKILLMAADTPQKQTKAFKSLNLWLSTTLGNDYLDSEE
jgi:hypothetical protein